GISRGKGGNGIVTGTVDESGIDERGNNVVEVREEVVNGVDISFLRIRLGVDSDSNSFSFSEVKPPKPLRRAGGIRGGRSSIASLPATPATPASTPTGKPAGKPPPSAGALTSVSNCNRRLRLAVDGIPCCCLSSWVNMASLLFHISNAKRNKFQ